MKRRISVIGAGFSGMSAAAFLAHQGMDVTVYEKNSSPGGRAGIMRTEGFTFDLGPSWYWMPDVFESFFEQFGKKVSDYYQLERLDPAYRVFFGKDDFIDIPAGEEKVCGLFDSIEPGSAAQLKKFLDDGRYKYELGLKKLAYKPSLSVWEFLEPWLFKALFRMDFMHSVTQKVRSRFTDPRLIQMLEFPVLFLGAKPSQTPAIYTLMNYADLVLGTWYPAGGMHAVAQGFYKLALEENVKFMFNSPVSKILLEEDSVRGLLVNGQELECDMVLSTADYHFTEMELLDASHRSYSEKYWDERTMAPSALLFYLGLNKRVKGLQHHNLFFDEDFGRHAGEIYDSPQWPTRPAMYVSCSSKTDHSVAPEGHENLIVLIPVAPGLQDDEEIRKRYFGLFLERMEKLTGEKIAQSVVSMHSYACSDFVREYNSFKGNAYGLANTLRQTAVFKPSLKSRKSKNLFYAGQLTVPGPGIPPCIISGQIAATEMLKRI